MSNAPIVTKPLSQRQVERLLDKDGMLSVVIEVDLTDLLGDVEQLNNLADERILKNGSLGNHGFGIVGSKPAEQFSGSHFGGSVYLRVTASPDFY